jgi:maltooligosyltrehalose trehalohydrolase
MSSPYSDQLERMNALGASILGDAVTFSVWAPRCRSVEVVIEGRRPAPLAPRAAGLFEAAVGRVPEGAHYHYRLNGGPHRPDPASRWQPQGVHGPSVVVDPRRFAWTDQGFRGHAFADLVFYELHVGTFTPSGSFEAVAGHLSALADLGVTALQLMPVAEFPGPRNWGYDGVHLWAPQSTYGGPRGLRRLVDACHARGIAVFLDVVYNHLGPEGNYLAEYGPYFTERATTPWGPAVNFDGEGSAGVRRHVVENGRAWVREFHIDGFRLDAVHAIHDASPVHVLTEFADAVRAEGARAGRRVHVVAESHDNERRLVLPVAAGGLGLDAVWSDDFHHALHHRLTGETVGYYGDFAGGRHLPRALAEGFAYQGEASAHWGRPRGTPSADLGAERFVIFAQNHDQVGNRPRGERLGALVSFEAVKLAAGLMLAAPAVPLLFMGEEYGETAPFQFFTSFLDGELAERVRRGRAADLARFGWTGPIADPGAPATFAASRLNLPLALAARHRALREYYRRWLELRRTHPALGARDRTLARAEVDPTGAVLALARASAAGAQIRLVANLGPAPVAWAPPAGWRLLLDSDDARFGGPGRAAPLGPRQLLLYELER